MSDYIKNKKISFSKVAPNEGVSVASPVISSNTGKNRNNLSTNKLRFAQFLLNPKAYPNMKLLPSLSSIFALPHNPPSLFLALCNASSGTTKTRHPGDPTHSQREQTSCSSTSSSTNVSPISNASRSYDVLNPFIIDLTNDDDNGSDRSGVDSGMYWDDSPTALCNRNKSTVQVSIKKRSNTEDRLGTQEPPLMRIHLLLLLVATKAK